MLEIEQSSPSPGAAEGPTVGRPRLLFLNRSYWPDAEATGQLLTELCEDLAGRYQIVVVAGQPNQNPTGATYRESGLERRGDVEILRVRHFRFPKSSLVGRVANLLSYLAAAAWASLRVRSPDVVVVETDPPLLCLLGGVLRRWHRCRLVVYLQDVYPDVAVALGKVPDGWPVRLLRRLFFAVYRRADQVVVLSDDMRALLIAGGVPEERVTRIPNWADTREIYPVKVANPFRLEHRLNGQFVVMYSGNMGLSQRLENLLEAADRLKKRTDVRFLLVGDGATRRRLEQAAKARGLANVEFLDYQPKDQLCFSLSGADLQLVVLDPKLAQCLMPSKLYGILAAGTPVLAAAPENSELAQVTSRERVGLVVMFNDPKSWVNAIEWAADHRSELDEMGRRARQLADNEYDRRRITRQFGQMLAGIVPTGVPSPNQDMKERTEWA